MKLRHTLLLAALLISPVAADDPPYVQVMVSGHNTYNVVVVTPDGVGTLFLLDTGASISAIPPEKIANMKSVGTATYAGWDIEGRLADGSIATAPVFTVAFLEVAGCVIKNVEVAAMGARPILGMNVIVPMSPFTLNPKRMTLTLSRCP